MALKRKLKSLARKVILKAGPSVLWLVPNEKRRNRLRFEMFRRRKDHLEIVEEAAKQPRGSLSLDRTLLAARSARVIGRDDINRDLLEACHERVKTSAVLLNALANDRIKSGHYEEAQTLNARARILSPVNKAAARTELRLHKHIKDGTPLNGALLRRFKADMSFVWSFCKACETKEDLDQIFEVLAPTGTLPAKYIRPYSNAALRAEQFDLGRVQFLRAIEAAAEKPPTKTTAAKSIGDAGSEALVDIVKLLNTASVPHFAAAGSCLGMVREGRPLPHDNDIDIGIMEADFDQDALLALTEDSPLFTSSQPHPKSPKIGLKHINGAEIDLFKFYEEDGMIWHNGVFVRWGNKPFSYETRPLNGTDITIPAGTDYLVENYGTGWDQPDPLFDAFLNGPNREVIWDEYYAAHMLRTINLTLRRGNLAKAVGFMRDGIDGPYLTRLEKDVLRVIVPAMERKIVAHAEKAATQETQVNG